MDELQTYSNIAGNGPPTDNTPGVVGQIYTDTVTGDTYECVGNVTYTGYHFVTTQYTWKKRKSDSSQGSTGLPSVTTSDNGKFLRVVDGAWAADSILSANGVNF